MAQLQKKDLYITDFDKKINQSGQIEFFTYHPLIRLARTTGYFLLFATLSAAAVFIPILHFILVPVFSIVAVATAYVIFNEKYNIKLASGTCPYCQKSTAFRRIRPEEQASELCQHCLQLILITS